MADADSNPYAAPETDLSAIRPRLSIWRFTAMALCFLVGGCCFMLGLFVFGLMSHRLLTDNAFASLGEMLVGCALYLGFGGAWLMAGWCFWQRKDRWGVLAFVAGILIPITLFSIFGV